MEKHSNLIKVLLVVLQDKMMLWIFEIFLVAVFFYVLFRSMYDKRKNRSSGLSISVKRGKESVNYFHQFATGFTSLILGVIISISEVAKGHKVFLFLFDLIIVLYLSYWNSWSRNKIVGLFTKIEKKEEDF